MAKAKNRASRKKAQVKKVPIMGLAKPFDYEYLWDELTKGETA
jgi:hypothetical protein